MFAFVHITISFSLPYLLLSSIFLFSFLFVSFLSSFRLLHIPFISRFLSSPLLSFPLHLLSHKNVTTLHFSFLLSEWNITHTAHLLSLYHSSTLPFFSSSYPLLFSSLLLFFSYLFIATQLLISSFLLLYVMFQRNRYHLFIEIQYIKQNNSIKHNPRVKIHRLKL